MPEEGLTFFWTLNRTNFLAPPAEFTESILDNLLYPEFTNGSSMVFVNTVFHKRAILLIFKHKSQKICYTLS